jgi:hypothetical protein
MHSRCSPGRTFPKLSMLFSDKVSEELCHKKIGS